MSNEHTYPIYYSSPCLLCKAEHSVANPCPTSVTLLRSRCPAQSSHLPAIGRGGGGWRLPRRRSGATPSPSSTQLGKLTQHSTCPSSAHPYHGYQGNVSTTLPDKKWDTSPACNKTIIHPMTPTIPPHPPIWSPPHSQHLSCPSSHPATSSSTTTRTLSPAKHLLHPTKHLSVPPTSIL